MMDAKACIPAGSPQSLRPRCYAFQEQEQEAKVLRGQWEAGLPRLGVLFCYSEPL